MSSYRKTALLQRKQPRQTRSTKLVAVILQAAEQVLAIEGARKFTTARVAEKAGVSVGSIYQYFPNKASILFRLQSDEWFQTTKLLRQILEDRSKAPLDRLRKLVHVFFRSECDEAELRGALADSAPLYRHAPEARQAMNSGQGIVRAFLQEALPDATDAVRARVGELITSTFSAVGKRFSESPRTFAEIRVYADGVADMLCAYLERLQRR